MAEPHDLLFPPEEIVHVAASAAGVADLLEHPHGELVGAAVQRSLQGSDRGRYGGVHVRERRGDDPGRERRGVHGVVRVQDEQGVERIGSLGRGLLAGEHVQEVGCMGKLRVRLHDRKAIAMAVVVGDQRGDERHQPDGLAVVRLRALVPAVGIVGGGRRDAGPKHRHRRGLLGERWHEIQDEVGRLPVDHHLLGQLVQLFVRGEPQVVQEVGDLLERRVLGQVVDRVADVPELAELAVDVRDRGLRRYDFFQAFPGAHEKHLHEPECRVYQERVFSRTEPADRGPVACRSPVPTDPGGVAQ